ncbi:DUF6207 family protein [Streptomyces olivaceus]|uniref:DUF6207 family protein n=1 Tax=Streptomyces olivaceus TaxID=47716 RepID=UPI00382F5929
MEAINEVHVSQPGLVVVDVAAADDETEFRVPHGAGRPVGDHIGGAHDTQAGQPGVRLRCYLDLRQPINTSGQAPVPH